MNASATLDNDKLLFTALNNEQATCCKFYLLLEFELFATQTGQRGGGEDRLPEDSLR